MAALKVCEDAGRGQSVRSTAGIPCVPVTGAGMPAGDDHAAGADAGRQPEAGKTLRTYGKRAPGHLRASTLLEAIVASIVFLTVFALSLETVTRLVLPSEDDELAEVAASQRIDACRRELDAEAVTEGESLRALGTDTVRIEVRSYPLHDDLLKVTLSTPAGASGKVVRLTYMIRKTTNDETDR